MINCLNLAIDIEMKKANSLQQFQQLNKSFFDETSLAKNDTSLQIYVSGTETSNGFQYETQITCPQKD